MERIRYEGYNEQQAIQVGYDWDGYEQGKTDADLFGEILGCESFGEVRHITIANWQGAFECEGCQDIVDWLVENAGKLAHIESLRMGDMDSEECELSWINQADYGKLWAAMPWLKHIAIQGAEVLTLGKIESEGLESIEIICGGLPSANIKEIEEAKVPHLKKLNLYLGVENYGFGGSADPIERLLANSRFPELAYLGLCNSEIAADVARLAVNSQYAGQIQVLDLSKSVFTDDCGQILLDNAAKLTSLKLLDLSYHYLTEGMQKQLAALPFEVDLSDPNEYDEEEEYYNSPMFTE